MVGSPDVKARWREAKMHDWLLAPGAPDNDGQQRRDYLTRETFWLLGERAKWFVLDGLTELDANEGVVRKCPFFAGTKEFSVWLRKPALVIFEWNQALGDGTGSEVPADNPHPRLLASGFLVVEAGLMPGESSGDLPGIDDILLFNELFRYWQAPYAEHTAVGGAYLHSLSALPVDWRVPARTLSACDTDLKDQRDHPGVRSVGLYLKRWDWMLECPLVVAEGAFAIVPTRQVEAARSWVARQTPSSMQPESTTTADFPSRRCDGWLRYADNRAFVWTCATYESGEKDTMGWKAAVQRSDDSEGASLPAELRVWGMLLNVDSPGEMWSAVAGAKYWLDAAGKRTYRRWAVGGTLYGCCYHAVAMLSHGEFSVAQRHFGSMYFDQGLLLFYLRITLFRFSDALARISGEAIDEVARAGCLADLAHCHTEANRRQFEELRAQFTAFTNLYQYPLISNQQQGVELYGLFRREFDVSDLFQEIKAEVDETHEFLSGRAESALSDAAHRLTVVGTIGLAVSIGLSVIGSDSLMKAIFGSDGAQEVVVVAGAQVAKDPATFPILGTAVAVAALSFLSLYCLFQNKGLVKAFIAGRKCCGKGH